MHILTIVGARPQFIKAAVVSRAIARAREAGADIREDIIHTGQHYDAALSDVFFSQMGIPQPAANLNASAPTHGKATARMLAGIEEEILRRSPDALLVFGDTDSTLAGALAAAKLHVPVAHVEAGLRSFNRRMPEEVNRILTDHASDLLLCPTRLAVANLEKEGITAGVFHVGDVMYDAAQAFGEVAAQSSRILAELELEAGAFALATAHRAENTDDPARLRGIIQGLATVARDMPVILPLHPRTKKALATHGLADQVGDIRLIPPVPYLDMVRLEQTARLILTDSGGVQKEAFFHGVPCVTLRDETEWVETIHNGWNTLAGADADAIAAAARDAAVGVPFDEYGDGEAGQAVVRKLMRL